MLVNNHHTPPTWPSPPPPSHSLQEGAAASEDLQRTAEGAYGQAGKRVRLTGCTSCSAWACPASLTPPPPACPSTTTPLAPLPPPPTHTSRLAGQVAQAGKQSANDLYDSASAGYEQGRGEGAAAAGEAGQGVARAAAAITKSLTEGGFPPPPLLFRLALRRVRAVRSASAR